jgi:hypothetical protein
LILFVNHLFPPAHLKKGLAFILSIIVLVIQYVLSS